MKHIKLFEQFIDEAKKEVPYANKFNNVDSSTFEKKYTKELEKALNSKDLLADDSKVESGRNNYNAFIAWDLKGGLDPWGDSDITFHFVWSLDENGGSLLAHPKGKSATNRYRIDGGINTVADVMKALQSKSQWSKKYNL
jgi:hypothetical protein